MSTKTARDLPATEMTTIGTAWSPEFVCDPPHLVNASAISTSIRRQQLAGWLSADRAASTVTVQLYEHCWLAPRGLLLASDGRVLGDSGHSDEEVAAARNSIATVDAAPRIKGPSVLLTGRGQSAYGHWLAEILPTVFLARQFVDVAEGKVLVPRVTNMLLNTYVEALDLLGIDRARVATVRNMLFWCDQVVTVVGLARTGESVSPLVRDTFDELASGVEPTGNTNLFLSRQAFGGRRIANFEEIEPALAEHGFAVVEPEKHSLRAQIAMARSARTIVGTMGSALTNMAFAPSGGRVLSLAPTAMLDTFFWRLANLCGHGYYEFRCPVIGEHSGDRGWDQDIVVDPQAFSSWLAHVVFD